MSDNEKKLIALLQEKRDLLANVLRLTQSTPLKNNDDALKYIQLMDSRQVEFDKIYEIDLLLEKLNYNIIIKEGSIDFKKEAHEIYNASRAVAFRLATLDKASKAIHKQIVENFKNEFKAVNQGKNARNIYSSTDKVYIEHYFDRTK